MGMYGLFIYLLLLLFYFVFLRKIDGARGHRREREREGRKKKE